MISLYDSSSLSGRAIDANTLADKWKPKSYARRISYDTSVVVAAP